MGRRWYLLAHDTGKDDWRSFRLDRVDPDYRARLEGDAFASLSPESAATLRRNMDVLVPLWSQITGLTAQHG